MYKPFILAIFLFMGFFTPLLASPAGMWPSRKIPYYILKKDIKKIPGLEQRVSNVISDFNNQFSRTSPSLPQFVIGNENVKYYINIIYNPEGSCLVDSYGFNPTYATSPVGQRIAVNERCSDDDLKLLFWYTLHPNLATTAGSPPFIEQMQTFYRQAMIPDEPLIYDNPRDYKGRIQPAGVKTIDIKADINVHDREGYLKADGKISVDGKALNDDPPRCYQDYKSEIMDVCKNALFRETQVFLSKVYKRISLESRRFCSEIDGQPVLISCEDGREEYPGFLVYSGPFHYQAYFHLWPDHPCNQKAQVTYSSKPFICGVSGKDTRSSEISPNIIEISDVPTINFRP